MRFSVNGEVQTFNVTGNRGADVHRQLRQRRGRCANSSSGAPGSGTSACTVASPAVP